MKGFLISLGLIIAAGIFLITSYSKIGQWVIADVVTQEGTPETMKAEVEKDETAFSLRCQPFLERRALVGKFAEILDEDYFMDLSQDTLDRYTDTPLQTRDEYAFFLIKRAMKLDERTVPKEAYVLFKRYQVLFPNSKDAAAVRAATIRLSFKYGFE